MQALLLDIKNQVSPQTLNLTNSFSEAELGQIIEALFDNFSTSCLNLSFNKLWGTFGEKLYQLLTRNSSIQKIDLSNNEIGDDGIIQIAKAIKINISLTELNLNNNQITDEGGYVLLKALESNSTLTSLQLSWNEISEQVNHSIKASLSKRGKVNTGGLPANRVNFYETQISSFRTKLSEATKQLRAEKEKNQKIKSAHAKTKKALNTELQEYHIQTKQYLERIDELNEQFTALQQREYSPTSLAETKTIMQNENNELCRICEENPVEMVIIPCGHYILCHSCIDKVQLCPYCRCKIVQKLKVFK